MTERIPCKNADCRATILPRTAEKTGGYCMPCVQYRQRLEREEFIRRNRRDVNLYEGITDPVEILKIMCKPRVSDPLIRYTAYEKTAEELYASLSAPDAERMKAYAAALIAEDEPDIAEDVLLSLACFAEIPVQDCLPALIRKECYHPGILYKQAPADIRDFLLDQVEKDAENRNLLLLALAWIGDEAVAARFNQWRETPPVWAEELYVPPHQYSLEAGWMLNGEGLRSDLFYKECRTFEKGIPSGGEPVSLFGETEEFCRGCGGGMTVLFDLDLRHPSLRFLDMEGERLKIATCLSCTCYGFLFTDIDGKGGSGWSRYNPAPAVSPEPEGEGPPEAGERLALRFSGKERGTYYAAVWSQEPAVASQVGGHPTWIQDAEYPDCPGCSGKMSFLAQFSWEDADDYGEGITYAFVCKDCQIAATHFQQT
ncbi:DUF1963 domain-containing protein [Paenibacillus chitinolyticus]|uniref:DUF1963 domain-containing protein n=1 Tax=Paenibacillus chitinolyticus TaxID=79263 RepID=UPI00364004A1